MSDSVLQYEEKMWELFDVTKATTSHVLPYRLSTLL
jgi:hypothetical protein